MITAGVRPSAIQPCPANASASCRTWEAFASHSPSGGRPSDAMKTRGGGPSPGNPRVASKPDGHHKRPAPREPTRVGDDPQRGGGGRAVARASANSARMRRLTGVSCSAS